MNYALWDTETDNLLADYDNERDALALVRRAIERNGVHDADTIALDVEDEHGDVRLIACGQKLAERAQRDLEALYPVGRSQTSRRAELYLSPNRVCVHWCRSGRNMGPCLEPEPSTALCCPIRHLWTICARTTRWAFSFVLMTRNHCGSRVVSRCITQSNKRGRKRLASLGTEMRTLPSYTFLLMAPSRLNARWSHADITRSGEIRMLFWTVSQA